MVQPFAFSGGVADSGRLSENLQTLTIVRNFKAFFAFGNFGAFI